MIKNIIQKQKIINKNNALQKKKLVHKIKILNIIKMKKRGFAELITVLMKTYFINKNMIKMR